MKEKEMYISLRDRIKLKITFCTIEKNMFYRFKLKCIKKLNFWKDVVFLEYRFSEKLL